VRKRRPGNLVLAKEQKEDGRSHSHNSYGLGYNGGIGHQRRIVKGSKIF
jgi:hypothetical protein